MTLAERIAELIEQHGSLRAAARVLECDPGYLSRLQSGEKDSPEDWLLRRMKLRRVVTYERAGGVAPAEAPSRARCEFCRQEVLKGAQCWNIGHSLNCERAAGVPASRNDQSKGGA